MNESCLIVVFGVKHHILFSLVAIFLKHLLLDLEILFVVGFRGIEVSSGVKAYRLDVFFINRVRSFFGDCFVRFGEDRFNSYHFPNKIKV